MPFSISVSRRIKHTDVLKRMRNSRLVYRYFHVFSPVFFLLQSVPFSITFKHKFPSWKCTLHFSANAILADQKLRKKVNFFVPKSKRDKNWDIYKVITMKEKRNDKEIFLNKKDFSPLSVEHLWNAAILPRAAVPKYCFMHIIFRVHVRRNEMRWMTKYDDIEQHKNVKYMWHL